MCDEDNADAEFLLERFQQVEDSLLYRHVEGCGGLVGDDDIGIVYQRHGNHHALLLSATKLVGVAVEDLLGAGEEHLTEKLNDTLSVTPHLEHLLAAFLHRVEGGHGLLENHADAFAADAAEALFVEG